MKANEIQPGDIIDGRTVEGVKRQRLGYIIAVGFGGAHPVQLYKYDDDVDAQRTTETAN